MPCRRPWPWLIVLLATALHGQGMARSPLPAQDGLKFIRVARAFHHQPWPDVVRGTDQHPLYSAAIALAQPAVALGLGHGPTSWRVAAQGVSALASILLLWPLHGLTRALFGRGVADLSCLIYVLLPTPAAIGHDTLSDPLALLACVTALDCGRRALAGGGWRWALAGGFAAGFGFLTRPEVLVAPLAIALVGSILWLLRGREARENFPFPNGLPVQLAALSIAFLAMVGAYATVKGEVSEKLALRRWASLAPSAPPKARVDRAAGGLDDPRWDFSPKQESAAPGGRTARDAAGKLLDCWAEGMGWLYAPFVVWGLVRSRSREGSGAAKLVVGVYALVYATVLVRHATGLGYLSARHCLSLVVISVPWAASGLATCARRVGGWMPHRLARGLGAAGIAALIVAGAGLQAKEAHASRLGHRAAGRWLAEHAGDEVAILDTRGWAAFLSGRSTVYDAWHVRQAVRDGRLGFIVVGSDELDAEGPRASTLRALLAYSAEPAARFAGRPGGSDAEVCVYRFRRPESWEAFRP